jgi:hypothetical protein
MKSYLLVTFGALMLLVPALAGAATVEQQGAQPQSNTEIANSVPAQYPTGNFASQPAFGPQAVPVTTSISNAWSNDPTLYDSTMDLLNRTGGGR